MKKVTECRIMDQDLSPELKEGREELVKRFDEFRAAVEEAINSEDQTFIWDGESYNTPEKEEDLKAYYAKLDEQMKQARAGSKV